MSRSECCNLGQLGTAVKVQGRRDEIQIKYCQYTHAATKVCHTFSFYFILYFDHWWSRCLQHPYLYARDIEPTGLSQNDAHEKLIDASAKLRLLQIMLPKLKARGHRVLLFSQVRVQISLIMLG